jgi:putative MFS transporter
MARGFVFLAVANLIGMIGQFSAGLNMDYLGRRPTVAYSVILLGLVPYFLFWLGKTPGVGMIFLIILYIFNSSSFASMYAYAPENFPTRVRATGTGFANAIGRGGGMLGPTILGIVYAKAGLIWALNINMAVLVCAAIVVLAVGRETKGKTLEQISIEQIGLKKALDVTATAY